jgi:two-component system nitrogen regulation sensor histidine kinase GlnL
MLAPIAKIDARSGSQDQRPGNRWQPDRILEALPAGVIVIDADGCCAYMNAAAEALMGSSRGQCLGRVFGELLPHDSPLLAIVAEAKSRQATVTDADIRIEGHRFHLSHAAIEVSPLGEKDAGVVVTIRDRQPERRMAQQSAADDAAQSVRSVAMMLAHEIKNPLSGIRGAAQLLETKLRPGDVGLAELIRDETDRIVSLVNGMEVFADDRPATLVSLNIHEVLEHARKVSAHGFAKHVAFRESYDPSLPLLRGNRDQLVQIFLNLIKNAAEAAPSPGAEIVLATGCQPGMRIGERSGGNRGRRVFIAVSDNGAGVPERLSATLFDPFVSGRAAGKGLGLALVARLVRLHDGLIDYESAPGRTTFTVYLPIDSPNAKVG